VLACMEPWEEAHIMFPSYLRPIFSRAASQAALQPGNLSGALAREIPG